ncbi:MAG TPA: molybdopterin biosynthesis protein MoeB, partial [Acidimicrobiaceae bacterium]|nr:molybdopterin biosynthesis protein MoeB [Acidimicrobiaceae bacterium]
MTSYGDLLAAAKQQIAEVDTLQAAQLIQDGYETLDVREPEEFEQGAITGAIHIPRGHLESQIEQRLPKRDSKIMVYCAGGSRSAFAAKTLNDLGYSEVISMDGGFTKWKSEGRPWDLPKTLNHNQRNRYQRHLLLPEIGEQGQQELLEAKVLLLGAGGLGSPAAMYLAAAGVGTLGIIDMDIVDESNLQRQIIHDT